ncbi:MAG TPA: trypsin-like peptidase domain-containing protein [Gammaproteobacteria bacterium]|nr:trypsin-like peptidase domain-containing protein [Gammaproteobacteria bacterium]
MPNNRQTLSFLAQSAVVGLAVAFVAVFMFPGLLPDGHPLRSGTVGPESYAGAVAATAPAVANLVGRPTAPAGFAESQAGGSLGSAVVMDPDGFVITNHHVIAGMEDLQVVLVDGRTAPAALVGTDPDTDIALLKIELPDLPRIRVGRSDQLRVGDVVLAIGNPFSIGQTVTQGIVSGTGRGQLGLSQFENFIQTDAAINVGNSGGALVNARGELVGINTAFFSRRLDSEGIGFAIPVNLVRGVMQDLRQHGRVIRGWLGVTTQTLTPDQAHALGLAEPYGIILTTVQPGSPADRAGLRPSDVITHVNDEPVVVWQDALRSIAAMRPGTRVALSGNRRGQAFRVEAEVAERPSRM